MSAVGKLIKNFSSSIFGNLLGQIIAFFIVVYLGKTFSPDSYGIYNFTQAYTMYFFMLGDLGLPLFAVREINQNDKKEEIAITIFNLRIRLGLVCLVVFYISIFLLHITYVERMSLILFGPSILFTSLNVDYLFMTYNDMKYNGRSLFYKNLIIMILMLLFIRNDSNILFLSFIYTISSVVVFIYLYKSFISKYYKLPLKKLQRIDFTYITKALPLAVSLFMVQINNNFDIVYLSFVKSQEDVGYYSAAYKIVNFLVAVLCVYFNASYSTVADLYKNNKKQLGDFISKFFNIGMLLVVPITFGGFVISDKIIFLLFKKEYEPAIHIFKILILLLLIRMITSTFSSVLMMGKNTKKFSQGAIIGASINIVLNIILIPIYSINGASIATVIAESIQGFYFYYYFKKECRLTKVGVFNTKIVISSIIMSCILYVLDINIFMSIGLGIVIYTVSMGLLNLKTIINYLKIHKEGK